MSTYKVIQDIEAEDKLVGALTLWQFIYALVAGVCIYLSAISVMKGMAAFLIILVPVALFATFLAIPWGRDQPTEVWALAKLRFLLKPRKRIWNQDGMTDLVTITVPKTIERIFTDGLSQHEVESRLNALANTLDSRGWAVKNVNVNMTTSSPAYVASDRLVDITANAVPDVVASDIRAADDILDETANPIAQNFNIMIDRAAAEYRQALVDRMNKPTQITPQQSSQISNSGMPQQPTVEQTAIGGSSPIIVPTQTASQTQATNWFMPHTSTTPIIPADPAVISTTIPQAAEPTEEEKALLEQSKHTGFTQSIAYGHLKTLKTPDQLAEEERQNAVAAAQAAVMEAAEQRAKAAMNPEKQAAIMNLARSNDLNISTLAHEARKTELNDGEVVISLH